MISVTICRQLDSRRAIGKVVKRIQNQIETLERLVDSGTRGDPESPLKRTIKSTRAIARELRRQNFSVGSTKVGELLKTLGYSMQANRKTIEGKQHPDRNAQFEFIAKRVRQQAKKSEPSISVDTNKKEVLGNLKNPGRVLRHAKSRSLDRIDPSGTWTIYLSIRPQSPRDDNDWEKLRFVAARFQLVAMDHKYHVITNAIGFAETHSRLKECIASLTPGDAD